jgi:hypothetical protein
MKTQRKDSQGVSVENVFYRDSLEWRKDYIMSLENSKCAITTAVNEKEKNLFTEIAREFSVSRHTVLRRLIRYFLDGKISWTDLLKHYSEPQAAEGPDKDRKKYMRVNLEPEEYLTFVRHAEEWGSTTSIILRRLVLLYLLQYSGQTLKYCYHSYV